MIEVMSEASVLGYIHQGVYFPINVADFYLDKSKHPIEYATTLIDIGDDFVLCSNGQNFIPYGKAIDLRSDFDYTIRPCHLYDIDTSKVSSYWKTSVWNDKNLYEIYDNNTSCVVAYIHTQNNIFSGDTIHILMFEVINKKRGIGRKIISYISSLRSITGFSLTKSIKFWLSVGANMRRDNYFSIDGGNL